MKNLKELESKFGKVEFEGKEYILTDEAVITGRQLEFNNNYNDVEEGEEFDFEMSASAIDEEEKEYTVYWIFTDIKGENEKDLDCFDYDKVNKVIED